MFTRPVFRGEVRTTMNISDDRFSRYCLVRDMLETPDVLARFDTDQARETADEIAGVGRLLMTGEGSSRLFPAKSAIAHARQCGWPLVLHTDAGRQAQEYDLRDWAVFALSNSGRTAEVIRLFTDLKEHGHRNCYSLTAAEGSKLQALATRGHVLSCGPEGAVAATKSVVEQAIFYRALLEHIAGEGHSRVRGDSAEETAVFRRRSQDASTTEFSRFPLRAQLPELAEQFRKALTMPIDPDIIHRVATAGTIYWAGRNDGVAEELTLKTNEITRKPADYLEGTYAVHGVEEVMNPGDVVLWIDPYEESELKFHDVLMQGVGLSVIAIAARPTRFPTILTPPAGDLSPFVQVAAGWNLLVEVGLALGIDLDKPQRARKVGNEFSAA
jgi:glucosamine--fructose-6-phosphate aminotransferase (isomerizing)